MALRQPTVALIAAAALLAVPAAVAKDFGPGDLLVCGRARCVPIMNKSLLRDLSSYYWGPRRVTRAAAVHTGAHGFELRFRDGHASGIVAGRTLDRFRAYGFSCGRFERGKWYRFPTRAAAALRKRTAALRPVRVTAPPRSC
jgi:hypothetical protein